VLNCIHYLSKFGYTKEQVQCQFCNCGHELRQSVPYSTCAVVRLQCTVGIVVCGS
jgi:hypothetical protein